MSSEDVNVQNNVNKSERVLPKSKTSHVMNALSRKGKYFEHVDDACNKKGKYLESAFREVSNSNLHKFNRYAKIAYTCTSELKKFAAPKKTTKAVHDTEDVQDTTSVPESVKKLSKAQKRTIRLNKKKLGVKSDQQSKSDSNEKLKDQSKTAGQSKHVWKDYKYTIVGSPTGEFEEKLISEPARTFSNVPLLGFETLSDEQYSNVLELVKQYFAHKNGNFSDKQIKKAIFKQLGFSVRKNVIYHALWKNGLVRK